MADICGDNRFELIEKYKQKLLDATNISDSPEEMAVIDNILFRFWQMGWLKGELFGKTEQLESYLCCHEKDHVADSGKMVGDLISRARAIETVRKAKSIGQAHRMLMQLPPAQSEEPSHEAVKEYCRKRCLSIVDTALLEKYLPTAQPNLSEAYSKAVFTWLMDYQIRTAELKGRYTPYEVLSWVINDWRKENG